jgi:Rieske Fe-S protein
VHAVKNHWSTQDYMSVDQIPYIGKLRRTSDRLYVATGFGKWGMTNGTVAGVVISDQILRRDNPWTDLFDPNRAEPLASAKDFVTENFNVAKRFVRDRITRRMSVSMEDVRPGEAAVGFVNGQHVAISRDDDGRLHAVSARCTHMGCLVNWNPAERSWDCPCHGSRFAPGGTVLEGPAVAALEACSVEVATT